MGVRYYKCGVGALEISTAQFQQQDLFNQKTDNINLMACLDAVNKRYGTDSLTLASQQQTNQWHMKRTFLSPHYTTRWQHLPKIACC